MGTALSSCGLGDGWHRLVLPLGQCWWRWGCLAPNIPPCRARLEGCRVGQSTGGCSALFLHTRESSMSPCVSPWPCRGGRGGGYQAGVQPWLGRGGTRVAFGGQPRARHAPGIEDEEFFFTRWQQTLRDVTLKLVAGPPWGQWMPGEGADLQPRPAGVDRVSFPLPPPL